MTHLAKRDDFNCQNLVSLAHMTFISVALTKEQSTLILVEADFRARRTSFPAYAVYKYNDLGCRKVVRIRCWRPGFCGLSLTEF
ncbi:Hypothetical protein CpMEX30_0670 [Corynebacterium pseudotuberculosis]|nr:Hypothetical protein CpE19_0632 [Corynebacterium pseudotuberculosis]APQ53749.1 Hypothetical protein CpMEX30_0670 [Corynebacterium pseudotuberculosis]APQ55826.1 Hypothetical protein CpMEX31_0675 [Corynebacterium pseudotuberculosis]ATB61567.1 Hypothetical protein BFF96_0677 [Corynebacterium pseudotuberculosis]AUY60064.1 Hypothetical protein BFG00_0676 [Corynebacterium pseudotuberculosis]